MADDYDPNAGLFGGDEPDTNPEEEHLKFIFGLNPNRTSAISDLFSNEMMATVDEEPDLPEEAKRKLIFKMTANSVLDMVMECLSPEMSEEVASCLDSYLGMCMVNKKFEVDLLGELRKAMVAIEQMDGESDDDYERRVADFEDAWWSIPQPLLNQRNPDDAIREEMNRYGLNE